MASDRPQTVIVGVSGGIGAYKACELVRELTARGFKVKVAMTEAATRFVGPLTFRTLTGEPVAVSLWQDTPADPVHHISLAQEADVLAIAPCTANVLAKLACGRADDILTTTALATDAAIVVAPAMNDRMWLDEATQENVSTLKGRGVIFVGPDSGELACGDVGVGRLAAVGSIADAIERETKRVRSMVGVRVLVTAGGTREPLDPVRYLGNRSSGRMGFAIAEEAARRGASVVVVAAVVSVEAPFGCEVVRVETAEEMRAASVARASEADVVVMAAAVADYRPVAKWPEKMKKTGGHRSVEFEETSDVLSEIVALDGRRLVVGFAAETKSPVEGAMEKLERKRLDMVVANDVSRPDIGFDSDLNEVSLVTSDGVEETGVMQKRAIACVLLDRLEDMLDRQEGA